MRVLLITAILLFSALFGLSQTRYYDNVSLLTHNYNKGSKTVNKRIKTTVGIKWTNDDGSDIDNLDQLYYPNGSIEFLYPITFKRIERGIYVFETKCIDELGLKIEVLVMRMSPETISISLIYNSDLYFIITIHDLTKYRYAE